MAAGALAGCLGGSGPTERPDPVAFTDGDQCDTCGMVIPDHPGPNGEIFYADERPNGHENPARFESLRACLFPFYFEHERLDWDVLVVYVTDYSTVEYSLSTEGDQTFISSHTAADSLTDGRDAFYAVGSEIRGSMGAEIISFSERADAETFVDEHDGEVLAFDQIQPETLER